MASRKDNNRNQIRVMLWGTEVGTLTWVSDRHLAYFHFSDAYFRAPYDICPITNPKDDPSTRFAIYGESEKSSDPSRRIYHGMPPFLADSLPDKWGNKVFDDWFREKGLSPSLETPLTKLSFIGNRAMGAFEFRPKMEPSFYEDKPVDISALYNESIAVEDELRSTAVPAEKASLQAIAALGTSPGGSHKKAIVDLAPDGTFHTGKLTGEKDWKHCIIKFNTPEYSLSEIEKTYYDLAVDSGIEMMPSSLYEIDEIQHFLTERYDRKDGRKVFTQSLAAINPEAETYEDLFRTCRRLGIGDKEIEMLFRQTAFNFLMNNTDDHKKNFSFMMDEFYHWHLTPAYDMTFIIAESGIRAETTHCMSLGGKFQGVSVADLVAFARKNDIKHPEKVIEQIRMASLGFEARAKVNGVNVFCTEMIGRRLNELGREVPVVVSEPLTFIVSGSTVSDIRFEKTPSGNIHVLASLDGEERKYVITRKKALYREIEELGFNGMANEEKLRIFKACFGK